MTNRSRTWGTRTWLALGALALAPMVLAFAGCTQPAQPTAVVAPQPACTITVTTTGDGPVTVNGCGNSSTTSPSPSPSPVAGGELAGFAIFCYGFGTQPGQTEPNHNACVLPVGYPEIAVTASPKDAKGIDIPNPGDITDPKVIDWKIDVSPSGAASLAVNPANRFNARVVPATSRVPATFTLTATYTDVKGGVHEATKAGGIQ